METKNKNKLLDGKKTKIICYTDRKQKQKVD